MKIVLQITGFMLTISQLFAQTPQDSVAVLDAAVYNGYVGAWIKADSKAMEESLHPMLVKQRVISNTQVSQLTAYTLINGAANKESESFEDANVQCSLLDITGNVATVWIKTQSYWDLVFVTKQDNTWLVTNIVFDRNDAYEREQGSQVELEQTAKTFIECLHTGNDTLLSKMLHPGLNLRKVLNSTEVDAVSKSWLVEQTGNKRWGDLGGDTLTINVEVISLYRNYASVKINSNWGTEFFHMRYINSQWYIINGIWERSSEVVNVQPSHINTPGQFKLKQNYPNPFNQSTIIKYNLQKPNHTTLSIYNLVGKELEILVNEFQSVEEHEITWQPKRLPAGIYFYRLQSGDFSETKKLIFQK